MTFIYSSERTKSAKLSEPVNKTKFWNKIHACHGREERGYLEQGEGKDWQELIIIILLVWRRNIFFVGPFHKNLSCYY